MSFILDALRKSESERQREAAPVLARTPFALIRRETPLWSRLVIASLSLALIGVGTAWWLRQPAADAGGATTGADSANAAPTGSLTNPAGGAPPTAAGDTPSAARASAATTGYGPGTVAGTAADATAGVTDEPRPIEELRQIEPSLPEYRLSLLATDSAYIDGRRYALGQRIGGGPEVVAVRPDGVVLAWLGERYLLPLR